MINWISRHPTFTHLISGLVFLGTLSTIYLPPSRAWGRIQDFLEISLTHYAVRAQQVGFLFDYEYKIPQFVNGLPLNTLALGDFAVGPNTYLIFSPFVAYAVNQFLFRALGVVGFYLLIRDHLLRGTNDGWAILIAHTTALSFALINHFPARFGLILFLPLFAWAIINIIEGKRIKMSSVTVLLYPFFWFFVHGGFFVPPLLFAAAGFLLVKKHPAGGRFAFLAVAFSLVVLFVEIRTVFLFLSHSSSSRMLHMAQTVPALGSVVDMAIWAMDHFVRDPNGHHVQGKWPFGFLVAASALIAVFWGRIQRFRDGAAGALNDELENRFLVILIITAAISLIWGFAYTNQTWVRYYVSVSVRMDRLDFLSPFLWFCLVATGAAILVRKSIYTKVLAVAFMALVFAYSSQQQMFGIKSSVAQSFGLPPQASFRKALVNLIKGRDPRKGVTIKGVSHSYMRVSDFFHVKAFEQINSELEALGPRNEYRALSFGMWPGIALFNGYYTLDGYFYTMPMEKSKFFTSLFPTAISFRPAMRLRSWVDESSVTKEGAVLAMDACRFKRAGGRVVFSGLPILNASEIDLGLITKAESPISYGRSEADPFRNYGPFEAIYVYADKGTMLCPTE